MKLSGLYEVEELIRTFQGNFSCQYFTKNAKGKPLEENERITLELFFLRVDIYPKKKLMKVYTVSEDEHSQQTLKEIATFEGK